MRKILLLLVLILLIGCSEVEHNNDDGHHDVEVQEIDNTKNELKVDVLDESNTVTFKLTGENYKYVLDGLDNPELRVKQGDKVIVEFESTQGFHDWAVDEFGKTGRVRTGDGVTTVEFIADKKGTFEYYCTVGNHRALGMKGNFIVE